MFSPYVLIMRGGIKILRERAGFVENADLIVPINVYNKGLCQRLPYRHPSDEAGFFAEPIAPV